MQQTPVLLNAKQGFFYSLKHLLLQVLFCLIENVAASSAMGGSPWLYAGTV